MKKNGFTLIESMVVITVTGILLTAVVAIMVNSFSAKNRTDVTNILEENGSGIIREVRKNLLNADAVNFTCPDSGVGNEVTITNRLDGDLTTIRCIEGASIASMSANYTIELSGSDVGVSGCNNFINCSTLPVSGRLDKIDVSFWVTANLGSTGYTTAATRQFRTTVVSRN